MTVRVGIRVTPGARRPQVGGSHGDDLVVKVTARAVDGAATAAACNAVAAAFGLKPRQVRLVRGAASRNKLVEIDAPADVVAVRLAELLA
ncbi:MAG: DUF167 domain-containing protein [Aquihabitans sp.]